MFELKFNLKGTINRKEFLLSMIPPQKLNEGVVPGL